MMQPQNRHSVDRQLPLSAVDAEADGATGQSDESGWVPLYRRMIDSPVWASPELWKVYCWCLMRASYQHRWVSVSTGRGVTEVELNRGQFIFGRHAAAAELQMPAESVRTRIAKLVELGLISAAPTNHFTIITISEYKTSEISNTETHHPSTTQTPSNHHPNTTNNKGNKGNKKKGARFIPPTFEEVAAYCVERNNGIDAHQFIDHYTANGWVQKGGQPIRVWKAAVRTWERNGVARANKESDQTSGPSIYRELAARRQHESSIGSNA